MNWSKSAESPLHPTTSMSMHAHASARCNSRKIRDTLNNLILKVCLRTKRMHITC